MAHLEAHSTVHGLAQWGSMQSRPGAVNAAQIVNTKLYQLPANTLCGTDTPQDLY